MTFSHQSLHCHMSTKDEYYIKHEEHIMQGGMVTTVTHHRDKVKRYND